MIKTAYLTEMTMISDQKMSETMPSTAAGSTAPPGLAALAATFSVYSGLVPMSPKTMPMQATEAGASAARADGALVSLAGAALMA